MFSIEGFQKAALDETRDKSVSDGQEEEDDEGEDHLHVGPGREAEEAHDQQLHHLAAGKLVDLALRNPPDVMVRRIGGLTGKTNCKIRIERDRTMLADGRTCSMKRRVMRSNI